MPAGTARKDPDFEKKTDFFFDKWREESGELYPEQKKVWKFAPRWATLVESM